MDQMTLPAGTTVKVNGLPFELAADTAVNGTTENYKLASSQSETSLGSPYAAQGSPVTNHPNDEVSATLSQLAKAFEAWENDFRAEPSKYLTAEECAAAGVSKLSASRAAHFMALLRATPGVEFYPTLMSVDAASREAYYASRCRWVNLKNQGASKGGNVNEAP